MLESSPTSAQLCMSINQISYALQSVVEQNQMVEVLSVASRALQAALDAGYCYRRRDVAWSLCLSGRP